MRSTEPNLATTPVTTPVTTTSAPPRRRTSGDGTSVTVVSHGVLVIWSIVVIAPLAWTLLSSFKTTREIFASPFSLPANWNFDNYVSAWSREGFGNYFLNTVAIVGSALVIVMTLGSMCAYVLARFDFPGNRAIYYLMLAGLTFPIFLAIVPLFLLMRDIGLLNKQPGLVVVYVAFALPFTVFFLYPLFKRLPDEIAEAAAVDGAGEWHTFFQ